MPPLPPPSPLEELIDFEARVETGEATIGEAKRPSTGAIVGVAVVILLLVAGLALLMLLRYCLQKRWVRVTDRVRPRVTAGGREERHPPNEQMNLTLTLTPTQTQALTVAPHRVRDDFVLVPHHRKISWQRDDFVLV